RDSVRVVDIVKDRRLDEQSAPEAGDRRAAAADGDLGFRLADLLVLPDAIELLAADERAHLRVAIERRPDRDRARLLDHRVEELLVDRPLHEDAASGRAHLALIEEDAEQRALDGRLEIGVGEKNVR